MESPAASVQPTVPEHTGARVTRSVIAPLVRRLRRLVGRRPPTEQMVKKTYASLGELEADAGRLALEGWRLHTIAGVPEDIDLHAAVLAGTLDDVLRASFNRREDRPVVASYERRQEPEEPATAGVSSGFGRLEDPRLSLVGIAADLAEAPAEDVPQLVGRVNRVMRLGLEPLDEAIAYALLVKLNAWRGDVTAADHAGARYRERLAQLMGLEPTERHELVYRSVVAWPDRLLRSHYLYLDELFVERPWLAFVFRDPSLYLSYADSYRSGLQPRARRRAAAEAFGAPLPLAQVRFLVAGRLFEIGQTAEALAHLEQLEPDPDDDPELFVCAITVRGIARPDAGNVEGARRDWEQVAEFDLRRRRPDVRSGPLLGYWKILAQALLDEPGLDRQAWGAQAAGGETLPFRRPPRPGGPGPGEPPPAA